MNVHLLRKVVARRLCFLRVFLTPLPGEAASPRFLLSPPFPLDLLALGALGADGFCTRFALACLLLSLTPHALHNVFGPSGPFRHNGVVCVLQCAHRFPATPGNNCPDVDASIACVIVSSRQSLVRIASRRVFFSFCTPFIHHPVPSRTESSRRVFSSRALVFPQSPGTQRERDGAIIVDASHDARDDATTRRRARRRKRRERYHHARIVSSSRVARARRRDDTSSASPRDDSARVRELIEFPPPVDTAPTRARRDETRHPSHEILLTSRARSRANHRPHRAVPRPMAADHRQSP